ncbi:hypothetical protein [Streptomyces sp. NPDC087300]|uniref:hypothetical protein n=1 Tax=Streptomyces sp. NPDC087300 TaxID=3365780 RepID=UPI003806D4F5
MTSTPHGPGPSVPISGPSVPVPGPPTTLDPARAPDPGPAGSPSPMALSTWIKKYLLPTLGLGGALLFGLLTMQYDQFYRELGMAPGDVDPEYSTRLSGSLGLVLMSLVASAALLALGSIGLRTTRRVGPARTRARADRMLIGLQDRGKRRTVVLWCCAVGIALVGLLVVYAADDMADRAKSGKWVEPMHFGPVTLLAVRAYPADVRLSVTDGAKNFDLKAVNTGRLLYIGHGPGTVVLYDHDRRRAVYLPAKDVTVTTYNCETGRAERHDRCHG